MLRHLRPHRLALACLLAAATACSSAPPAAGPSQPEPAQEPRVPQPEQQAPPSVTELVRPDSVPDTRDWVERTLDSLTLRQKIGQMIMPVVLGDYAPEGTPGHDRIVRMIQEDGIGGVIISVGSPTDVAVKLNDFQEHSRVPLLVGADLETGAGFRLKGAVHLPTNIALGGATDFPSLMALGATRDAGLAYEMGRITAQEARAVGIHIPFAPVLDVNSNPDNPVINTRSFGEDPEMVASLGAAFVRGVQEHGAIATAKHFPGHGDTGTDSHLGLPTITSSRARLDSVELVPFERAIQAGVGAIMTAHITVPALNGGNGDPSTLSPLVLHDLLREQLGFHGLVVTDAMDMGAIDRGYDRDEAAALAVEAGADIILQPPDVSVAIRGILDAVCSGRIPEARIDQSVRHILEVKQELGLASRRTVPIEEIPRIVGIPEHTEVAAEVARRSMTLLRNGRDLLPLLGTRTARVLSVSYRRTNDLLAGRYFNAGLRSHYPRLNTVEVTRDTRKPVYDGLLRQARASNLVVVSLYVTAVSYAGSVALPEEAADFIKGLERQGTPYIVISFGSPYLATEFPDVEAYMLAWSGSEASQRAAAQALFGDFSLTGRTPTAIPPLFEVGAGIQLPAKSDARR